MILAAVVDARGIDLWHMCRDYELKGCGDTPPKREDWEGTEEMREFIASELDGYQWGNRLYFTFHETPDPKALAATLVHEVNHVLNRSECSYYESTLSHVIDQDLAFVEEFRAFVTECILRHGDDATVERCAKEASEELVERGYDLSPDLPSLIEGGDIRDLTAELFEADAYDGSFGYLVPDWTVWPEDFDPCE